jgi:hypothetical protein
MMAATNNALLSRTIENNSKFIGGTLLQKELQGFAGFIAYQECFRQGNSTTISDLQATMGRRFFGDPNDIDSMGLAEQLVTGIAQFAGLYTIETSMAVVVTDENTSALSGGPILVLKHDLHCLGFDKRVLVGGVCGINLSLLLAAGLKNPTHLQTRTLHSRAQEHMKNGKKALALVNRASSPYRSYATTGKLPSGQSIEDYYVFVRRKMYVLLLPSGNKKSCGGQDTIADNKATATNECITSNDPPVNENEQEALEDLMPETWSFPGFITFALLGPIVPECMLEYRSELLMTAPPQNIPGNTGNGRAAMRKNSRAVATAAKVIGATPTSSTSRVTNARRQYRGDEEDGDSNHHIWTKKQRNYDNEDTTSSGAGNNLDEDQHGYNMLEHIQVMGIANSRQMARKREQARVNDLVINMHAKDVSGIKAMIEEQKFLISMTDTEDESRKVYVGELRELHVGLRQALLVLKDAEQKIIEHAQQSIEMDETDDVNAFLQDAMSKMKHKAEAKVRLATTTPNQSTPTIPSEVIATTTTGSGDISDDNESVNIL